MLTLKIKNCFLAAFLCMTFIPSAIASSGKKSVATKDTTGQALDSPYFLSGGIYLGEHFAFQGGVESDFNKRLTIGA
ncbi:MAG TPA: hypothetical protein VFJ43_01025, partial [Bacteroidia bacterium]|nr:hypothetical protein [Bacteroidia bacterium]